MVVHVLFADEVLVLVGVEAMTGRGANLNFGSFSNLILIPIKLSRSGGI
jgi:hypothetical protein